MKPPVNEVKQEAGGWGVGRGGGGCVSRRNFNDTSNTPPPVHHVYSDLQHSSDGEINPSSAKKQPGQRVGTQGCFVP